LPCETTTFSLFITVDFKVTVNKIQIQHIAIKMRQYFLFLTVGKLQNISYWCEKYKSSSILSRYFCHVVTKFGFPTYSFIRACSNKFHKNPSSGSRIFTCGMDRRRTDRQALRRRKGDRECKKNKRSNP
jgi:hypothetical protein